MQFNENKPIYLQIADGIAEKILSGDLKEGDRIRIWFAEETIEKFRGRKDAAEEDINKALTIAQAYEFVYQNPEGLDRTVTAGGKNLSGGQRQRLTIARALVAQPEILILDDSASALDFATDAALRRSLKEETKGMTVIMVSQRVGTVRYADKILVLDKGEMVGIGTHNDLFRTCKVYQEICLSQLRAEEVLNQ